MKRQYSSTFFAAVLSIVIVASLVFATTVIENSGILTSQIDSTSYLWNGLNRTDAVAYPIATASYVIDVSGSSYRMKNGTTGQFDFVSTNASAVINNAIGNLTVNGGTVFLKELTYNYTLPIPEGVKITESFNATERTFINVADSMGSPYTISVDNVNSGYYLCQDSALRIINSWSSTSFATVLNHTIANNTKIVINNGDYHLYTAFSSDIVSNCSIFGLSEYGVNIICSFPTITGLSYGSTSYLPSGQYAFMLIRGTKLTVQNIVFKDFNGATLGLGEYDSNTPSQDNHVENLRFINCSGGGLYFYDGSGSIVNNIRGDNPYGLVYFWYGEESNIKVSNLYMEPTLATSSGGVDSTVAFLPYEGSNVSNIKVSNVVGNYTTYFDQSGTDFNMGATLDFHSCAGETEVVSTGNVSWNNLDVSGVYGFYAPAVDVQWNFTGLTNSVFENLHSSHVQGTGAGSKNGVFILPQLSNANITISNVIFKDIFVDHAWGAGFNFLLSSVGIPSGSVRTIVQGITLENLYLTDNNQARGSNASANDMYTGLCGLNIGNQEASAINIFSDLSIKNLAATDDQTSPSQEYPVTFWNYGAATSAFTNIQIVGATFTGNLHNVPYLHYGTVTPTVYFLGGNMLAGVIPTASVWTTAPTNLQYCTDGNYSTMTGEGSKQVNAYTTAGQLDFDMGAVYSVELGAKLRLRNNDTSGSYIRITLQTSDDNSTWFTVINGNTDLFWMQPYITNTYLDIFTQAFIHGRYIRMVFQSAGNACTVSVGLWEIEAICTSING